MADLMTALRNADAAGDADGARRIAAMIQAQNAPQAEPVQQAEPPQESPERTWGEAYDDFSLGVGKSMGETYQGVRDLVGMPVDDTSKLALEMMRDDYKDASGWATAGNVAGEVGQMALPAGTLLKGAKTLTKIPKLAKTLSKVPMVKKLLTKNPKALKKALAATGVVGAEVGGAGTLGYLKAPEEGKTRMDRAADEAKGAAYGLGAGKIASYGGNKLIKGISKTKEAKELMRKGVELTPAQASKGGTAKAIEYVGQITPFVSKAVKKAKEKSLKSYSDVALKEAAPEGYKHLVTKGGTEGAKQLKSTFDDAYSAAWGKAKKPSEEGINSVLETGYDSMKGLSTQGQRKVEEALNDVIDVTTEFSAKKLKQVDGLLRKKIKAANSSTNPDYELSEALKAVRVKLKESAGSDTLDALKKVDSQYPNFLSVEKAGGAAKSMARGGDFTPSQLLQASKTVGSKGQAFQGTGPMRSFGESGAKTIEQKMPNPLINAIKGLMVTAPDILPTKIAANAMLGKNPLQKGAQWATKELDPLAKALREMGYGTGTLGAAIEGE